MTETSRLARFNEILHILIRNDLRGMVRAMSEEGDLETQQRMAEKMRTVLEELGPSFIKIGQLLATRPDLVPAPFVDEFKKLYDSVAPAPLEEVRQVIREELRQDVFDIFESFETQPLASASIGQVHRAKLADGTVVAVKVQHLGVADAMRADFEILKGILRFVERTFAESRVWQPTQHLEELRTMLEREFDYSYEMRNTQRVAANFEGDPTVHIPKMFAQYCTKRVLVMEFVDGIKFTRLDTPKLQGIDRRSVARIVTQAMARQIFVHRLFHADPSPGNLMILSSQRVAFLDFGAVGVVTERRAKAILRLITALTKGQVEETAGAVVELCEQRGEFDMRRLEGDVERILDFFEREEVSVADPRLMERILDLAKANKMLLPPDFILINRALFQFEGFCREMDPEYDLVEAIEPFAAELLWRNISSSKRQKELVEETVGELLRFGRSLPHTLNTLARKVERNEITTRVEIAGLEGIKSSQGRSVLKTAFTIMMAALLVGLAILYAGPDPGARAGPYLFASAAVLAAWLVVMILWSEAWKGNRD